MKCLRFDWNFLTFELAGNSLFTLLYWFSQLLLRLPYMDEANVVDREHESPYSISHGAAGAVTCKGGKCLQWIQGQWSKVCKDGISC